MDYNTEQDDDASDDFAGYIPDFIAAVIVAATVCGLLAIYYAVMVS